jgi:hypothetical protein
VFKSCHWQWARVKTIYQIGNIERYYEDGHGDIFEDISGGNHLKLFSLRH